MFLLYDHTRILHIKRHARLIEGLYVGRDEALALAGTLVELIIDN